MEAVASFFVILTKKRKIIIEVKYRDFAIHITQRVKIHIISLLTRFFLARIVQPVR